MTTSGSRDHIFRCNLFWTGSERGGTTSYTSYSRTYRVDFAGKPSIAGSAASAFRGDPALHDPEDLLVASLSACHALSYLAVAARAGVVVLGYEDSAEGTMAFVAGVMRFTTVKLKPKVLVAAGTEIAKAVALHEQAHGGCFIANSVNFPVTNEPSVTVAP
jgi:organic hydroperoxide reductase OsmC/OhrA